MLILYLSYFFYKKQSKTASLNDEAVFSIEIDQKKAILNIAYKNALEKYSKTNYGDALKDILNIYEQSKNQDHKLLIYKSESLLGNIYDKTNNFNKSIKYHLKSIKSADVYSRKFEKTNLNLFYSKAYLSLGSVYQKLSFNIPNDSSSDSKKQANHYKDSAFYFYNKLENIKDLNKKITRLKAISYYNISGIYQVDSLYNLAMDYANKSIIIHKKNNDKKNLGGAYNNLGNIYLVQHQYSKSKELYFKGIDLIEDDSSEKLIGLKAELFYNLAWALRNLKDYKAYDYQEKSYEIEDKEREKQVRKIIAQITTGHQQTLEQQKVDLVKSQTELLKVQKNKSTLLVSILSILGLIISGVVIYNYRLRQNNLQLKISQNKLIEEQNIDRIKSESQIKILNATIDGKETERKQIAETLHDSVSALLSSANMHLRATKKQFNGNTPVELEKTQQIILEASQKVRDLSHNLVSSILLKFGLGYAIKDIGSKYSNSELHFHTNISNISRYNQEFEIKLYNVIHELINNILKHSKASNAHIVLEDKNGFLSVLIEDDGIGFNYKDNKIKTGLGLNQIEARIQMMNGNFLIESAKEKGTKATITVPIKNRSLVTA
ncbi:ATP-binding protein [Tenacibaculum sp. E3R01]|uniref:tetratricopeptide repeat-containing sensor histidine kinase n=1 Tax=Tenacibaculum sp. E3R01 TaxID=2267227 RepID=UPI001314A601|nr:ATP-binding protein [Tenacibaculum sp. E3R01]